jgi:D-amino-acid oxidase
VNKWGSDTFNHYLDIFNSIDAVTAGIFLCPAYEMFHEPVPDPDWSTIVPSFRHLSPADLAMYDTQKIYKYGFAYDTIIAEGRLYMEYLITKIKSFTGRATILTGCRVESLTELSFYGENFAAVINCTGLGARELVDDASMYPIRGHVVRVKAPWIRYHVEAENKENPTLPAYIIPNSDTIVLGGTKALDDDDLTPRKEDRDAILARCIAAVPSLAASEFVEEWVGLRPGRPSVRLELERFDSNGGDMPPVVVSNYGHGGSGLTLAYGCAGDAVELLQKEKII